jgi:hypothetical protein
VVGTFVAGKTLNYNFGIFIYENAHRIIMCGKAKVITDNLKGEMSRKLKGKS